MKRFTLDELPLPGLHRVQRQRLGDRRGFRARLFCAEDLAGAGWVGPIAQINHTCTELRGTVRGLHYQRAPHAETKLVSCIRGEVFDVAVDLRPESPSYLRWHGELLSAENGCALLIPQGFAHGFQAMSDGVELIYCHSVAYVAEVEAGLHVLDPQLAISWPLPVHGLSPRDQCHAFLPARPY